MISMRAKFQNYITFANATMDKVLTKEEKKDALVLEANSFNSVLLLNSGGGKFTIRSLPAEAQLSQLNGMVVDDFDSDGNLDVVISTNDYGTEVSVGRYDALNGLYLKGDGTGNFKPLSVAQSGIYIPGNGKALVKLNGADQQRLVVAGQNRGPIKIFRSKKKAAAVPVAARDVHALIKLKSGKFQKHEFYYGSSFLSQSTRSLHVANAASIQIEDYQGRKRSLPVN
jgi:hypothetical protein